MSSTDLAIPIRIAGENDHLSSPTCLRQNGAHGFEPMRVGVAKDVIEDYGDAAVGRHYRRAGEPEDHREVAPSSASEAVVPSCVPFRFAPLDM